MKRQPVSMIAAIGRNRELGKNGQLIWHISDDLKRFKKITMGGTLIMGRKTFESIGKPLPGRKNIVLTSNKKYNAPGIFVKNYPNAAFNFAQCLQRPIFIIGGESIYRHYMPLADTLYITQIDAEEHGADAFFPEINPDDWQITEQSGWQTDPVNRVKYRYLTYQRKK